jgi:hypothetical protein
VITPASTTKSTNVCDDNFKYVGDGQCDDVTNNEKCNFDGGDCCLNLINDDFCTECLCNRTGHIHTTTAKPTTPLFDKSSKLYFLPALTCRV